MKQQIFETFANFSQVSYPRFYGILAPHFQMGKTKEVSDKAHEACCNGCPLYTLGKLIDMSATRR